MPYPIGPIATGGAALNTMLGFEFFVISLIFSFPYVKKRKNKTSILVKQLPYF
jgi:hypothetical protein